MLEVTAIQRCHKYVSMNEYDKRQSIFASTMYCCEVCGRHLLKGSPQIAHRINQSKRNIKKYTKDVIHHPLNLAPTCSLKCNSKVSLYGKEQSISDLVEKIKSAL